tara:strand:- start:2373 stop:2609 length:237 start_codon:yes stop_codon:yes gene_type:complete
VSETQDVQIVVPENVKEALSIVDSSLGSFMQRELISATEVTDVLLDIRSALIRIEQPSADLTLDIADVESEMEVSAQA